MKPTIVFIFWVAIFAGCSNDTGETPDIAGAYIMTQSHWKGNSTDTTNNTPHQMKLYTHNHMMYANVNPLDSTGAFGIATYDMNKDTLFEHVLFSSSGSTHDDTLRHYTLLIEKMPDGGFKQVIHNMETDNDVITLTEIYKNQGSKMISLFDGAWKMTDAYLVIGEDTIPNMHIQYKTYYAGHMIWASKYTDSIGIMRTGVGYGTFELQGNKLNESLIQSTFGALRNQSFDIDVELMGTDKFKQTIIQEGGSKSVEIYERIKKTGDNP